MQQSESIALVKRGFEAAMKGDYEALRPLLAEDVSYAGPYQPELHGIDEVIAGMQQWGQRAAELGMTWDHEYEGAWADERRVVILHHMMVTRDHRTFDTHEVQVVELRDGKAWKLTEYTAEPEKLAEMMS